MTDYKALNAQLKTLTEGIPYKIANLANASALLWEHLDTINWAGFYMMEDGALVLGPISLSGLAVGALVGIILNAVLPGNDYKFGKNDQGDKSVNFKV